MEIGLSIIFILVLLGPLLIKKVEENIEVFLLVMGIVACMVSGVYSEMLFFIAATDPIFISIAVIIAGILFKWLQEPLSDMIHFIKDRIPFKLFIFMVVLLLGLISSVITAIIAALMLVFIVIELGLAKKDKLLLVILSCFSIGLGAALTPIGEPLSIVTISKLNGDFFYLLRLIGVEILLALLLFSFLAAIIIKSPGGEKERGGEHNQEENYEDIFIRGLKIYFFVMGLTFLGAGFEPFISAYFLGLDPSLLYWLNMSSAILDNATLAAAEINPDLSESVIRVILLGLMISGGMLVPGNIPNIIAAGKLGITSKDWAKYGVPIGLCVMVLYYFIVL
ncbi:DUF1646 family protein [Sutcliffiella rhizosphaerae]|uniref:Cation transporter n=1 Tax=Sutcliffiella rhizosphaerae TaxID=2880967 RepID=A0ABM8YNJ0_9BACI|nr:DUF1646 family protein [Sutcliffiella rhizosphaerae]CAG9621463.1 hypothetical protein BACCIP111883_02236 [Sutcliffiella rhizosphaerae]